MHGILLSLMLLFGDGIVPADLTGKITTADGTPVPLATVLVHSGTPKNGESDGL